MSHQRMVRGQLSRVRRCRASHEDSASEPDAFLDELTVVGVPVRRATVFRHNHSHSNRGKDYHRRYLAHFVPAPEAMAPTCGSSKMTLDLASAWIRDGLAAKQRITRLSGQLAVVGSSALQ